MPANHTCHPVGRNIPHKPIEFVIKPSQIMCSSHIRGMPTTRGCKTDQIRTAWAAGDQIGALRIAARFFDRSMATKTFQRGIQAYNQPQFFCQLGKDPQELLRAALALLAKRFDLR